MTLPNRMEVVLVTGGTGFVAGWCIVELLQRGYAGAHHRARPFERTGGAGGRRILRRHLATG